MPDPDQSGSEVDIIISKTYCKIKYCITGVRIHSIHAGVNSIDVGSVLVIPIHPPLHVNLCVFGNSLYCTLVVPKETQSLIVHEHTRDHVYILLYRYRYCTGTGTVVQ